MDCRPEHFTSAAVTLLNRAHEEARRNGLGETPAEYILVALVGESIGVCGYVFKQSGVKVTEARREADALNGERCHGYPPSDISFAATGLEVIRLSYDEAACRGSALVGVEHLLLAIVKSDNENCRKVLENLGVELGSLSKSILDLIE